MSQINSSAATSEGSDGKVSVSAAHVDVETSVSPSCCEVTPLGSEIVSLRDNPTQDLCGIENSSQRSSHRRSLSTPQDHRTQDGRETQSFVVVDEDGTGRIFGEEKMFYTETILDDVRPQLLMHSSVLRLLQDISKMQGISTDNRGNLKLLVRSYEYVADLDDEIETESGILDRINVIDKNLRKHVSSQFLDISAFVVDLFQFVYRVFTTKDPEEIPNALRSLLRIHGVATIESILLSQLCRPFINFKKTTIYTEAKSLGDAKAHMASETVDQFGDMMEYVFDSAFADAVKNVIIAAACLKMTDYQMSMRIFEILGKRPPGSLFDITRQAVKSLAIIVRAVEDIIIGKEDLHTILFAKDRWVMAMQTHANLSFRRSNLRVGEAKPDDGKFDRIEWLTQAAELKTYLAKRLSCTSQAKPLYLNISNMLTNLDEWTTQVKNEAGAYYRPTPVGFCISGPPKIGKSSIMDLHAALHASVMGRKYRPELIYHRNMASKFHDGLKQQPYIHYSEVGSDAAKIAENRPDEVAAEIISIIDSQPMLANMASVDDKGKTWINFELVLVDTNNPTMNFDKNKLNPGAFLRRFLHVTAQVKSEFSDNGVTLSQSKAQRAVLNGIHPMDLWHFTLRSVEPEDNVKFKFIDMTYTTRDGKEALVKNLDVFEYSYAIKQIIRNHIASQAAILELRREGNMFTAENFTDAADYFKATAPEVLHVPDELIAEVEDRPVWNEEEKDWLEADSHISYLVEHGISMKEIVLLNRDELRLKVKTVRARERIKLEELKKAEAAKLEAARLQAAADKIRAQETEEVRLMTLADNHIDQSLNEVIISAERHVVLQSDLEDEKVSNGEAITTQGGVQVLSSIFGGPDTEKGKWFNSQGFINLNKMRSLSNEDFVRDACLRGECLLVEVDEKSDFFKMKFPGAEDVMVFFTSPEANFKSKEDRKEISALIRDQLGVTTVCFGDFDFRYVKSSNQLDAIDIDRGYFSVTPISIAERDYSRPCVAGEKEKFLIVKKSARKTGNWLKGAYHSVSYVADAAATTTAWCWDHFVGGELGVVSFLRQIIFSVFFTLSLGWFFGFGATLMSAYSLYTRITLMQRGVSFALWARSKWNDVYDYFNLKWRENFFENWVFGTHASTLLLTFASIATLPFALSYMKERDREHGETQNGELTEMEDEFGCGSSVKRRSKAAIVDDFGLWDTAPSKSKCTGQPEELTKKIMRNVRYMEVREEGFETRVGYVTGVQGDICLTASHYFWGTGPFTVKIYTTGSGVKGTGFFEKTFNRSEFTSVGDDVVAFRFFGLQFVDILAHIGSGKMNASGNCFVAGSTVTAKIGKVPFETTDKVSGKTRSISSYLVYPKQSTKNGSCGLPVIYQKDKGSALCAIHSSGSSTQGYASIIDKEMLTEMIKYRSLVITQSLSIPEHVSTITDTIDVETELTPVSIKSPFHYNSLPNIQYRGMWPDYRVNINQRSLLINTRLSQRDDFCDTMYEVFGEFQRVQFGKPMMKPKTVNGEYLCPYSIALLKADKQKAFLDTGILERVILKLSNRLVQQIRERGIESLSPLKADYAINGDVDDDFLRRISASTASGFGFSGKKGRHLPIMEGVKREMTPELERLICDILKEVGSGNRLNFVYVASLKDEPRDVEKVRKGKTRVFYISPLPLLILQRMFLSPFYTLMVQMSDVFSCALGVNMHSEGHSLYEKLSGFSRNWMEGDYGGFDLQMPFEIGLAAASVVIRVLRDLGYSESALSVVTAILDSGLFPTVCMNGDIFCVPALQPSGKYATAEDNSLRGLIMLLYFWETTVHSKKDFFSFVLPLLYGDDMLAAVKDEVSEEFNNLTYSSFVSKVYKMEFTTAQKTADIQKFVCPDKASFLKRRWKEHAALGFKVAALELDSIYRMLTWMLPSTCESESVQILSTYDSALREAFFHLDDEHYDRFRSYLLSDYVERWPELKDLAEDRLQLYPHLVAKFSVETESGVKRDLIRELEKEKQEIKIDELTFRGRSYAFVRQTYEYCNLETFRKSADDHFRALSRLEEIDHTVRVLEESEEQAYFDKIRTQSGTMDVGLIEEEKVMYRENVTDVGGDVENSSGLGNSIDLSRPTSLTPSEFFMRPVKIAQLTVPLSTDVGQQYDIWNLLSLDPSVRAKFRNYSLMRAGIEITVEVAASPFHYGRLMFSYIPKTASNEITSAMLSSGASYRFQLLQYLSQQIGTRTIDMRENKPLVMHVPYINYQPFCRLYVPSSATSLGTGTSIPDLATMGKFCVYTLNQLKASNSSAPTSALVYVYARFVDVTLAALTASQTAITTESGEMETGPVEKAASSLAVVSDALTRVPFIKPWAQAASMIFGGVGKLASIFGWSAPRVEPTIDPPRFVYNQPLSNNAVTIARSMAMKLSFDPLQATGVDPRIVGVDVDELAFATICSKMSLLTQFSWSPSSVPMSATLWSAAVIPNNNRRGPIALSTVFVQPTPVSFVSQIFDFWCGEIEYVFDFVASALHRGKVLIQVEPNIAQYALITSTYQLNKEYSLVLDLQETQRVSICVKWMQPRMWLRVPTLTLANRSMASDLTPTAFQGYANGYITVTPFTTLQSPDGSAIDVNVFVRSQNIRFNQLDNVGVPSTRAFTESGFFSEEVSCKPLGEMVMDIDCQTSLNFGEQPVSFRSYIKRYQLTNTFSQAVAVPGYTVRPSIYPTIRANYGGASLRPDVLSYLRYAYLAMLGSVRKRLGATGVRFNAMDRSVITLNEPSVTDTTNLTPSVTAARPAGDAKGTLVYVPDTQGGLEAELPMYTNNYFIPSGISSITSVKALADTNFDPFFTESYSWYIWFTLVGGETVGWIEDTGAAEDFTLMRWMGAPFFSTTSY